VRTLLLIAAACGSSSPPVDPGFPLPPDNAGSATPTATRGEESTEECIPSGAYKVQWDFANAKITGAGGLDDELCRPMVEGLATQGLAEMKISHPDSLSVAWPGPQTVIEKGACAFDITSKAPTVATIKFSGGTGNGTASFSIETKNHPGERCDVEKATFMLSKQP
jgi:hypothetical protein